MAASIMVKFWVLLLLVNCFNHPSNLMPTDPEQLFVSHHVVQTNHSDTKSVETMDYGGSSSELAEKPYVPFDPVVVEGNAESARQPLRPQTETSVPTATQRTEPIWTTVPSKLFHSTIHSYSTDFSTQFEPATNKIISAAADLSQQQPEEIDYLNRAVSEIIYNSKSPPIETTVSNLEVSREYSDEDNILPTAHDVQTTENVSAVHDVSSTAQSLNISKVPITPAVNDFSLTDQKVQRTSTERTLPFNATTTAMPAESHQEGSPSMLVTKVSKPSVRFTVSAEDTRNRTQVESFELDNSGSSSSEELFQEHHASRETSTAKDNLAPTLRQSKSIDSFHVKERTNNLDVITKPSLRIITRKFDATPQLSTQTSFPSTTPMVELESLEALFSSVHSLNLHPVTVTSIVTSTQTKKDLDRIVITTEHGMATDFSSTDVGTQNSIAFTDLPIANITIFEQTESDPPSATFPTTTTVASIERATVRRRLMRPLSRTTKSPKPKKPDRTIPETTEFGYAESPQTTSTPLKTLQETIAPPVLKSSDEIDYVLDMENQINFFEGDVTEVPVISAKTTNTIIISSIVGGCAVVFFAFLTIFCKCKQKYNRRTLR